MLQKNTFQLVPILALALFAQGLRAATYFVSPAGDDGNTGTSANPFLSISRAASLAVAGDVIYVHGGVYRESVSFAHSGTAAAPIVLYGYPNESVTVSGADPVTGWQSAGANLYEAPMSWTMGQGQNQVFLDGSAIPEAAFPHQGLDPSHPAFSSVGSITSTSSTSGAGGMITTFNLTLNDAALSQPAHYWQNALVHLHRFAISWSRWVALTATITDSGPGWINFSYQWQWGDDGEGAVTAGNPYYITGKERALTSGGFSVLSQNNEWLRDGDGNVLNLVLPSPPSAHLIEAKHRALAFDLSGSSNILIDNINIFAAGVKMDAQSSNNILTGFKAQYLSHFGVINQGYQVTGWGAHIFDTGIVVNGNNNTIENCEISYSAGNGVSLQGSNHKVTNCYIHDVDYAAVDTAAIFTDGTGHQVTHNTLANAGRSVLVHRNTKASKIMFNEIKNGGLQMTDLGGTYAYGTDGGGTEIAYNWIHDIDDIANWTPSAGIYLDNGTQNYLVHHNVIWNVPTGIKVNAPNASSGPSGNYQIYNNTVWNTYFRSLNQAFPNKPDGTPSSILSSKIINNIFYNAQDQTSGLVYTNNVTNANPGFVNPNGQNFQLSLTSAYISGATVIAGITAPSNPSYGAYQFSVPVWVPGYVPVLSSDVPPPVVLPPPAVTRNAYTPIFATSYDQGSGIRNDGNAIGLNKGNWALYKSVDFGSGAQSAAVNIGVNNMYVGRNLEFHIDSTTGPLIGSLTTTGTGPNWNNFENEYAAISGVSGVHDLYVVVTGIGAGELVSFQFSTSRSAFLPILATAYNQISGIRNDGNAIGLNKGNWALYKSLDFGTGAQSFVANIGVNNLYVGRNLELHLDSLTGPLVGALTTTGTGPTWNNFQNETATVSGASGVHDLYLVVTGVGAGELVWFRFATPTF